MKHCRQCKHSILTGIYNQLLPLGWQCRHPEMSVTGVPEPCETARRSGPCGLAAIYFEQRPADIQEPPRKRTFWQWLRGDSPIL